MQIQSNPGNEVVVSFGDILDQAPDGVIFADHEGIIRVWNQGAQTIFGYASTETLGKSLDIIIPERFRSAHWNGFYNAMATGHPIHVGRVLRTRSVHKDGTKLYVDLTFGMVKDTRGIIRGSVAIARNATAHQASEVQNDSSSACSGTTQKSRHS
ncbi:MAG: PAS domain S-box protein [Ferrovum sp.]|nr:PAS domain S-box protein [Ferrovum sp.]